VRSSTTSPAHLGERYDRELADVCRRTEITEAIVCHRTATRRLKIFEPNANH
jgi:hypothetical protein